MSNIVIGIVLREEEINDIKYKMVPNNNMKYLYNKCSYIGIMNYNNEFDPNVLELVDGIIIPGGRDIYPYHFKILDFAIKNNIPILGICMGCEIIGLYSINKNSDEYLTKVNNHCGADIHHKNTLINGSLLYNLLGSEIEVNSRHMYANKEIGNNYKISAIAEDGTIEGIEYIDNDHFVLGVQWHPEDMDNMSSIYDYFLKEVIKRKISHDK